MEKDDGLPSQQALLDVERSQLSALELLDDVARILGVAYRGLQFGPSESPDIEDQSLSHARFAPKEEWVLRWLLKKAWLTSSSGKGKPSAEDSLR